MISAEILEATRARREAYQAQYPKNAEGRPHCPEHGYVLSEEDYGCRPCAERDEKRRIAEGMRQERIRDVERWFSSLLGDVEGLGGLPRWEWARFKNAEWTQRCDPRILSAVRTWDLRSSLALFGETGSGKSSAIVARCWSAFEATRKVAETRVPDTLPVCFYITGYELGEATKRRRLGHDEHAAVTQAMRRGVVILDELHPSHTPADVVFAILDQRNRAGLPTVICAGMSAIDFGTAFGAAAVRRALEGGKLVDVFVKGGG